MAQKYADSFDRLVSDISDISPELVFGHNMKKYFQFDEKWINLNQGQYKFFFFFSFFFNFACVPDHTHILPIYFAPS